MRRERLDFVFVFVSFRQFPDRRHGYAPLVKVSVGGAVPVMTVQAQWRVTVSVAVAASVG